MSQRNERPRFEAKPLNLPSISPKTILFGRLALAALLLVLAVFVFDNKIVKIILLVLSALASGYDLGLKAFDSILEKKYFASPIILLFVTFVSFLIGYGSEGAAMLLLYQLSLLVTAYVMRRTRASAMQLLNGLDQETTEQVKEIFQAEDVEKLQMEGEVFHAADLILKLAMVIALIYIVLLPRLGDYTYSVSIHRALMIILTAIPASVVVSMPFIARVGLCYCARNGILFRNGRTMERASEANVVVMDKAGIFSSSAPELESLHSDVLDQNTLLSFAAHAVYYSEQPFAKAIPTLPEQDYKLEVISDFVDVPGCGVEMKIGGSPVMLATAPYLETKGIEVPAVEETGEIYYLTVSGRYVGYLCIVSQVNENGSDLLDGIRQIGVRQLVLLTEDGAGESMRMADDLGFDEVFGECDVERKLKHVDDLNQGSRNHVMFVYANGLETHSAADVDVRLSKKTKYADVTIQPERANVLPLGILISRRMVQIAKENAIFVFVIKAILILLSMLGFCSIWFVLFMDVVAVLASLLNAIRVTKEPLIDFSRFLPPKEER